MPERVDATALTPRQRWLSLGAVYACIFANGLGMGLSLPLLSLILERNGVSGAVNGLNVAFGLIAAPGTMAGPGLGGFAIDAWRPFGLLVAVGLIATGLIAVVATRILTVRRPIRTTHTA